jgi:hypothetical protein
VGVGISDLAPLDPVEFPGALTGSYAA